MGSWWVFNGSQSRENTVIQAADEFWWRNHDCKIVCCMQTLEATLDEMYLNGATPWASSHSCGQKQIYLESQLEACGNKMVAD